MADKKDKNGNPAPQDDKQPEKKKDESNNDENGFSSNGDWSWGNVFKDDEDTNVNSSSENNKEGIEPEEIDKQEGVEEQLEGRETQGDELNSSDERKEDNTVENSVEPRDIDSDEFEDDEQIDEPILEEEKVVEEPASQKKKKGFSQKKKKPVQKEEKLLQDKSIELQKKDELVEEEKKKEEAVQQKKVAEKPEKTVREKKKGGKKKFFFIFLLIIMAGAFFFFKKFPSTKIMEQQAKLTQQQMPETLEEGEGAVQVKAFRVASVHFEDSLGILGTVKGYKQVDLRFQTNGVIDTINFREGDSIIFGEEIATLKPTEALLRLEYNNRKLKVQEKKRQISAQKLKKKQAFYDAGAIIEAEVFEATLEYEAANAQYEMTKQELELAKNELTKTKIYSPMNAVMGTRDSDPGEFVNANTKVGSIFDISQIYVELGVIEKEIRKIEIGQKVRIFVEAYPGVDFEGTINKIPSIVEGKSRTMPLKIEIQNENFLLKPGMFVRSKVFVFEKDDALIVPALSLIDSDGDGSFDSVFVIEYGEAVKLREVQVGYVTTDYAEVLEGIEEGEEIIVETAGQLEDGTKVEITDIEEYGL